MSHRRFHAIELELIKCEHEVITLLQSRQSETERNNMGKLSGLIWFEFVPSVDPRELRKSIVEWKPFSDWYSELDSSLVIERRQSSRDRENGIMIQSIDFFGSRIGFVKFKAFVTKRDTRDNTQRLKVPGIVFMRGAAVALLPVITVDGDAEPYTLLTLQARVPIGKAAFPEIPAGMMDGENNFVGTAARELKEETGILPDRTELTDLTKEIYGNRFHGMYPSPGGCDEYLRIFLWERKMSWLDYQELIRKVTQTVYGVKKEGEEIKVKVIKLKDLHTSTPDAKALSALTLYNAYKR